MTLLLHILFWLPVGLLFHSYVLFPLWLEYRYRRLPPPPPEGPAGEAPRVSVLIPAYNEEAVIEEKIRSVYASDYPLSRLEVLVMSDASTDATDHIIQRLAEEYSSLKFFRSPQRTGKPGLLNRLAREANGDLLVLTDANVLWTPHTLKALTLPFADASVGLVDSCLIGKGEEEGIALQEKKYTLREVRIRHREGAIWGFIMGPSGACYALRKELYTPVPDNFLVDDFFITMKVLEQGYHAKVSLDAEVYEDVTVRFPEAFRRKVRIAAGNFQNLARFFHMFRNITTPLGFCFWSHKGIRWLGPWLLLLNLVSNLLLFPLFPFYLFTFAGHLFLFLMIAFDNILSLFGKQIVILRFITHFYSMNLALGVGSVKALKGIRTNVWEPTKRNPQGGPEKRG